MIQRNNQESIISTCSRNSYCLPMFLARSSEFSLNVFLLRKGGEPREVAAGRVKGFIYRGLEWPGVRGTVCIINI